MTERHKKSPLPLAALSLILWLSITVWLSSCKKSVSEAFSDLPVVESYLAPENKIRVKISRETSYEANTQSLGSDINSLDIKVMFNRKSVTLIPMGEGVYKDTSGIIPVMADSTYELSFQFNGKTVLSSTTIPSKPTTVAQSVTSIKMKQMDMDNPSWSAMPDPVKITFANSDNSYYVLTVECIDATLVPVIKDSIPENAILSSMPMDGTQIDIMPMSIRYFGRNRIILYHINPEYTTFFTNQSSTSQNYQEPPSNVTNGLGIFTGLNTDTLYLDVIRKY